ncbi:MAG: hypothetical protein K2Q18_19595, partial [Bdellovibrionales bacterium]|nr:hypothetical protein [Bdellovibrionales bacterium]
MLKKILTIVLIMNFIFTSCLYAQDGGSVPSSGSTNESGKSVFTKVLDSSLTPQIARSLGEPGFYAAKFLNFRKQVNKPVCTLSEQLNSFSVMTSLTGDVVTHAYVFFEGKKLQKKFADKIQQFDKYQEELKKQNKKLLDYDASAPNIQLDALRFLEEQSDIELKRVEMSRAFTYTSLGLSLSSKILASMEGTASIG